MKQLRTINGAFWRNGKRGFILIFDEATSALDSESERAIQQNLDRILKDRTTLIIARRLSSVRNADRIIVMDMGAIVEQGNHYSLMRDKGMYYYLRQSASGNLSL